MGVEMRNSAVRLCQDSGSALAYWCQSINPFVVSDALLAEYRTLLVRPTLRKFHGLTVAEVEANLTVLAQHAIVPPPVPTPPAPPAPDPGDQLLWELLTAWAALGADQRRYAAALGLARGRQILLRPHYPVAATIPPSL